MNPTISELSDLTSDPATSCVRALQLAVAGVSGDSILCHSPLLPWVTVKLSREQLKLLRSCEDFRTPRQHAQRYCDLKSGLGVRQVESEIRLLALRGLLAPIGNVVRRCAGYAAQSGEISSLVIPSANRPHGPSRTVRSHTPHLPPDRNIRWVVADHSGEAVTRAKYQNSLAVLSRDTGADIAYAGLEERRAFLDRFCRENRGFPRRVLEFAFFDPPVSGYSTAETDRLTPFGATRNALLLNDSGSLMLSVDDDTVGTLRHAPDRRNGLALQSRVDAQEYWFDAGSEPASNESGATWISVHEALLGKNASNLVASMPTAEIDFSRAGDTFLASLGGRSDIVLTMAGANGDPGIHSRASYYHRPEAELRRLPEDADRMLTCLDSMQVVRSVCSNTIAPAGHCISMNLGIDNRRLLPPFPPVLRNEDGVFAALIRLSREGACFGFVPFTTDHRPFERRRFSSQPAAFRCADILCILLGSFRLPSHCWSPEERLRLTGRYLQELAVLRHVDLTELIADGVRATVCARVADMHRKTNAPELSSQPLRKLLEKHERECVELLCQGVEVLPSDLGWRGRTDEVLALFQRLLSDFGTLLTLWPDVVSASRQYAPEDRIARFLCREKAA